MGQRTQIVLKIKDRFGRVKNKVYHEQWGYMCTMPLLAISFFTDMAKGKQRKFTEEYLKPRIVKLSELKALPADERKEEEERLNKFSVHNLSLNAQTDTTDEYTTAYVTAENTLVYSEDFKTFSVYNPTTWNCEEVKLTSTEKSHLAPLLTYDFDITDAEQVRLFEGDNNDGFMVISVEEVLNRESKYSMFDIVTKVGFCFRRAGKWNDDTDEFEEDLNRKHDIINVDEYTEEYNYTDDTGKKPHDEYIKAVRQAFHGTCKALDVEEVTSKAKELQLF